MRLWRSSRNVQKRRATARRRLKFEPLEPRALLALDLAALAGTAYVDLTGDGLTPDDTRIAGATVELWRDDGDNVFDPLSDTLLGTTSTNGVGQYRLASSSAGGALPANTLTADDYFVRQLPVLGYSPPAPVLVTITPGDVDGSTVEVVDSFDTTAQAVTAAPFPPTASSSVPAPEALGGERDVVVTYLSGSGQVSIQINQFGSHLLAFEAGLSVVGTATIQYDGPDNDPLALDPTGLGSVDLSGGSARAGLLLATRGDSPGATAVIRLYSDGANYSSTTITIPDQAPIEEFFVPFSAFAIAGGTGADFASIGAIELHINGVADLDATVTVLASLEPTDLPVNFENQVPSIALTKFTNGVDAHTPAAGPYLPVGATATFTYEVRNTGAMPLQHITVVDDNGTPGNPVDDFSPALVGGDTNSNNLLESGETWTYQATRVVTAGSYANTGSVTAEALDGTPVADSDLSHHFGVTAAINLVKATNGQDANAAPGPYLAVGSTATFTYTVTNVGNVPLASLVMRDDNGTSGNPADDFSPLFVGGDTNSNGQLDLTETWTYQATRTVTSGQYTNVGTVTGTAVNDSGQALTGVPAASDSDPSNHVGAVAGINIVKLTNAQDANTGPGPLLPVGSTATFTYVVTNTGTTPVGSVTVRDDNGTPGNPADDFAPIRQSGDTNGNGLLDVTETWTYQATRTVAAGPYTNVATVTGQGVDANGTTFPSMPPVSDTDASNHFGFVGGVGLQKLTNGVDAGGGPGPTLEIGSTAVFTYRVTNSGNVALTNITLTDDNGTPADATDDLTPTYLSGDTNGDGALDVTEVWIYQATRIVTAGAYTNAATVRGEDPAQGLATATDLSAHRGVTRLSKRRFLASRN